ncbi:MAG: endolytic transglycosylase MltG [Pseudomonadota bacterium]
MWRHLASNAVTFLIVSLFLTGGVILWGQSQYTSEGPLEDPICVLVESGTTFNVVSEDLAERGAISNPAIFRIGADYEEKSNRLKAGSFLVEEGASMQSIVDAVTRGGASTCGTEIVYRVGVARVLAQVRELDPASGDFIERAEFQPSEDAAPEVYTEVKDQTGTRFRVALAEGVTSWQITEALKAVDILAGEIPEVPPEGALAPDSYEIVKGGSRTDLLARMRRQQEEWVAEAWEARDADLPLETPEELLTLASIIEKETSVSEERPLVSSVFVNRLNQGMRLQTDPTVIYGVTRGQGVLGRGLRRSELRASTPWNTYVIPGLPPTPIANPGKASLLAAGQPENSEYLFFVADGTGGHAFAETLDEHNANVARWRQIEAERAGEGN